MTAKNCVRYLGCELDRLLTKEGSGQNVIAKVNQKVTFLARKATFLDKGTLKVLSTALVQPHYDYACTTGTVAPQRFYKRTANGTE